MKLLVIKLKHLEEMEEKETDVPKSDCFKIISELVSDEKILPKATFFELYHLKIGYL